MLTVMLSNIQARTVELLSDPWGKPPVYDENHCEICGVLVKTDGFRRYRSGKWISRCKQHETTPDPSEKSDLWRRDYDFQF